MLPAFLLTVTTPLPTTQSAGLVVSLVETHCDKFFPSNKTIASDGGSPKVLPGDTILGTGDHTSVSSGFAFCCAFAIKTPPVMSAMVHNKCGFMYVLFVFVGYIILAVNFYSSWMCTHKYLGRLQLL